MPIKRKLRRPIAPLLRALIEVFFIIFLFYANLLMGEFTRHSAPGKTLAVGLHDILTPTNFTIAIVSAMFGYLVVESLRRYFR
jgi:hypothetical protein